MSMDDEHVDSDPRSLRTPVDFDDWPTTARVQHVAGQYTRRGLIEQCLLFAGRDIAEREIDGDTQLTKDDLAAIYLTLEGSVDAE